MSLRDMIDHIERVTRRLPTAKEREGLRIPPEVRDFRRAYYSAPYGPDHPGKGGRVPAPFYDAREEHDLGLCFGTWCRDDRQCLVGADCPWRHYLDTFAIGFIWRSGANDEGHKFLVKALKCLQAGDQEPVHTYRPFSRR
ncbi:hypothetical protein BU23DRAFT_557187 [Bimuria novae-zelandiae CBS 107.79]|uniref:Uncharacterized protein n=1 Tax=Bimuria novae-zelandiae CBS 107.79 TaxID=1447943 RepID=A0A6A5UYX9_9PLEO|nr:hypothetical protein BU23DRAFT_557187 [Bimuria novae-zelandiae CBS 107.79]